MRVVALDFGERRIGLAVSDPSGTLDRAARQSLLKLCTTTGVASQLVYVVASIRSPKASGAIRSPKASGAIKG